MKYISTRGQAPALNFMDVLLAGLAQDGGLYVPESWPVFSREEIRAMQNLSYTDLACRIMQPFVGDSIPKADFTNLVQQSYQRFMHPDVTPLEPLISTNPSGKPSRISLLNLAYGPTLAFKDVALQLVGRLFGYALNRSNSYMTVLGATSGDTGSAAIEACRGHERITTFILFPHGRTSEVQRRQMTTVPDANVHALAVEGTFDDCQSIVKTMFSDRALNSQLNLTAVNSINWARIMAQVVYYFHAALKLGAPDQEVSFSIPTGNFGDAFAGYAASKMGLPIRRLVIATNSNNILHRFLETGNMLSAPVAQTHSPSMDIVVSSNFERLLFSFLNKNSQALAEKMESLRQTGKFSVNKDVLNAMRGLFASGAADNTQTEQAIVKTYQHFGRLIDPHTAVGVSVVDQLLQNGGVFGHEPVVCLETAHPAKFPDVVEQCTGIHPALPPHMADLFQREERTQILPNDVKAVVRYVRANTKHDSLGLC